MTENTIKKIRKAGFYYDEQTGEAYIIVHAKRIVLNKKLLKFIKEIKDTKL